VVVVIVIIVIEIMLVDRNTSGRAAADSRTDRRGVAACADNRSRGNLRNKDEVSFRIGRHGVGAGRLWDAFDEEVGSAADHAQLCSADGPAGAEVIAIVASVVERANDLAQAKLRREKRRFVADN
jgi:hypothetical protein